MDNIRKIIIFLSLFLVFVVYITSCNKADNKSFEINFSEEYNKYLPKVEKYCINKNLRIRSYIGKTFINIGNIQSDSSRETNVVYEWNVENIASGEQMVLQFGPVLYDKHGKQIINTNAQIMLSKERYEITTKRF